MFVGPQNSIKLWIWSNFFFFFPSIPRQLTHKEREMTAPFHKRQMMEFEIFLIKSFVSNANITKWKVWKEKKMLYHLQCPVWTLNSINIQVLKIVRFTFEKKIYLMGFKKLSTKSRATFMVRLLRKIKKKKKEKKNQKILFITGAYSLHSFTKWEMYSDA